MYDLVSNGRDIVSLQDHLPEQTQEEGVVALAGEEADVWEVV